MEIYRKLLNIQSKLKVPKSQYNNFGKYKYRNCEDILEVLKPLCVNENVVCTIEDEIVQIGSRYYVKSTATLTDAETSDAIKVTAFAREEENKKGMDNSQVTGASSSYARKYALNGLLAIDDTKDSDATNKSAKCCVCGKLVNANIAEKSLKVNGKVYCSGTCKNKGRQQK